MVRQTVQQMADFLRYRRRMDEWVDLVVGRESRAMSAVW